MAGNGLGVIVGCLQQYRDGVSSGWQQVERHGRTHSMASSSNSSSERSHGEIRSGVSSAGSFLVRQHRGAEGTGLVVIGWVFVGMDEAFVFTMDTPVDRFFFFD